MQAQDSSALRLVQTIPLPNVDGRIDHMAVDVTGQRLFIAALGNNSVEVLDLRAGKHLKSITAFSEPQGVGFIPEFDKTFIANGEGGACDILNGSSFERIKSVKFSDDADTIFDMTVPRAESMSATVAALSELSMPRPASGLATLSSMAILNPFNWRSMNRAFL